MNQSAILAAALIGGFGLFLASRDRLPVYARILWGDKPGQSGRAAEPDAQEQDGGIFPNWTLPGVIEDMTDSDFGKTLNDIYKTWDN